MLNYPSTTILIRTQEQVDCSVYPLCDLLVSFVKAVMMLHSYLGVIYLFNINRLIVMKVLMLFAIKAAGSLFIVVGPRLFHPPH
jgi:hypothetical protein